MNYSLRKMFHQINRLSFFSVIFSVVFLFSAVACADIICISSDSRSINYVKEDSTGNFSEIENVIPQITNQTEGYPSYDDVFFFRHNKQNRVLVIRRDSENDVYLMIYDPENFSAPIASKSVTMPYGHSGGVAEFGNNIIIGKNNAIYEINPETCELVGEPYKISNDTGDKLEILVHEGLIYVCENMYNDSSSTLRKEKLEIMDRVGHVTGSIDDFDTDMEAYSGNLYFGYRENGIFRMNHNEVKNRTITEYDLLNNNNYATKILSDDIYSFCSDGKGGFYYILTEKNIEPAFITGLLHQFELIGFGGGRDIYHYDGTTLTKIFTLSTAYHNIGYDHDNKTLWVMKYPGTLNHDYYDYAALKQNGNGQFEVVRTISAMDFAVVSKTSSEPEPTPPAPIDLDSDDVRSNDQSPLGSPDGTCNGGFGIFALAFLTASFLQRKKF